MRYKRMRGKKRSGFPAPTRRLLPHNRESKKNIQKSEGKTRHDLGPRRIGEARRIYLRKKARTPFSTRLRRMGASLDWSRYAYTLDDKRNNAVIEAFKRMYDAGLIYRGHRIVNWDPKGQTTISDDEIVYEERNERLFTFKYGNVPLSCTARPETKFGDKYVVMHPDDARYKAICTAKEYDARVDKRPLMITIVVEESRRSGLRHWRHGHHALAQPDRLRYRRAPRARQGASYRRVRANCTHAGEFAAGQKSRSKPAKHIARSCEQKGLL